MGTEGEGVGVDAIDGDGDGDGAVAPASDWVSRLRARIPTGRWRTLLVVGGLSAVVVVPMLIAIGVLRDPRWFPLSDMAQIELRVRDVGFDHPPLLGLGGRLQGYGTTGSHPGPLSFFMLAPVFRLLGADGTALLTSSIVVSLVAAGLAIWIGYRRGGWRFALAVTVILGLLIRTYGAWRLAEAWNPNLPIVWWFVFLLAVWSVVCDDLPMLPVAAFAGSYCAQTHIPYVGLVIGLGGLTAVYLVVRWFRRWRGDAAAQRRLLVWGGGTAVLGALLWLPPVIEQINHHPGNIAIIIENFRNPYDKKVTFGDAFTFWAQRLDIRQLFSSTRDTSGLDPIGSKTAGLVCVGLWAATAAVAVLRRRDPALVRLHLTVAATLGVGLVAISRIFGPMWTYLGLWMWGVCALMTLAMAWTLLTLFTPRASGAEDESAPSLVVPPPSWPKPTAALLGAAAVAVGVLFSVDAAHSEMPHAEQSHQLSALMGPTVDGLRKDPAGCGDDCHYLLTWADPYDIGAAGYGMVAELEGQGFDARALAVAEVPVGVRPHRLIKPADADAVVHLAVGVDAIEAARERPGSQELAYFDPNTPKEQADYLALRRDLVAKLRAEGFDEAADKAERLPYSSVSLAAGMSHDLQLLSFISNQYKKPAATFVIVPQPSS